MRATAGKATTRSPASAYGRSARYGDGRITIIGVKGSAGWALYSQTQDANFEVVDAQQIFDPTDKNA